MLNRYPPKPLRARPLCAVCMKPVERFEEEVIEMKNLHRFVARCHGEKEVVDVEAVVLASDGLGINFGVAFARPLLSGDRG